uniref:DUF3298 domain-containing protein n=1 Tax=Meloidogyne hapla TaxID=6305 RepID=A0A1I8BFG3_MELHA
MVFKAESAYNIIKYQGNIRHQLLSIIESADVIEQYYKDVIRRTFELEPRKFFTNFEQIDFYAFPIHIGGEFETNGIFDNIYDWIQEVYPKLSPSILENSHE